MDRRLLFVILGCALATPNFSIAQAVPTASRNGALQLGVGGTIASPDYGARKIKGISVYGDFDFSKHIGIEGDLHYINLITPDGVGENSYLLGPRFLLPHNRFNPYAKALFGIGRFQYLSGTYTYKIYSLGAGVDIRATHNFNVRAFDIEYQNWPGLKPHGLSPIALTFGVAYSIR